VVVGACLVLIIGAIGALVINVRYEARLVRVDPDTAAADPELMRFALPRGRATFKHRCAPCHGPDGQGRYTLGSANLTDRDWLYGTGAASDIETVVLYGIRAPNSKTWRLADMPAFGRRHPYPRDPSVKPLSPRDIDDVIQFLRVAEGRPAAEDAARRGSEIYLNKGGCYDCHGSDARGDSAIGAPNLTDNIWLFGNGSDKWIYYSIATGRAGVCPAWWGRLPAAQIREVALYVYSISHGSSQPKPSLQ
jgi:cytochrome c oxidase cbb3-type subunit 3